MSLSKEWVNTELSNSEFEVLHRAPDVEYSFYNSVKAGDMDAVIENCIVESRSTINPGEHLGDENKLQIINERNFRYSL